MSQDINPAEVASFLTSEADLRDTAPDDYDENVTANMRAASSLITTLTAERDAALLAREVATETQNEFSAAFLASQALVQSMREALEALPDRTDQPNAEAFAEAVDDWWKEIVMPTLSRSEV